MPQDTKRLQLENAITDVTHYIAKLISNSDTKTSIKNSKWTVGDAAAHLVISQGLFRNILKGEKSPYGDGRLDIFSEVNEKLLKDFTDRKGESLSTKLISSTKLFLDTGSKCKDGYILNTHFGEMNLLDGLRYSLCHLLMHGTDIALALDMPIPVKVAHVELILPFFKEGMTKRHENENTNNINLNIELDIRNVSKFNIVSNAGKVTIQSEKSKNVDCHISVDPVTFFLVSTGVAPLWESIFKGKIIIWGRRPWLALKLKNLFPNP